MVGLREQRLPKLGTRQYALSTESFLNSHCAFIILYLIAISSQIFFSSFNYKCEMKNVKLEMCLVFSS